MKTCKVSQHKISLGCQPLSNQAQYPAIELDNVYGLYSVWAYRRKGWELVTTTRLGLARKEACNKTSHLSAQSQNTISSESEATSRLKLVFPTHIQPNQVSTLCYGLDEVINLYPQELRGREKVLDKIGKYPGQDAIFLGRKLNMNYRQLGRHLRILGEKEEIFSRLAAWNCKKKLYFPFSKTVKF